VWKLLIPEDLLNERSFGPFEDMYLPDSTLDDFFNAAAYEKVHTGRKR
jgi:hypothetical protein